MDKKLLSMASVIFASVFVIIYLLIWQNSASTFRMTANNLNNMQRVEVPFDINLVDGKKVSASTIAQVTTEVSNLFKLYGTKITVTTCDACITSLHTYTGVATDEQCENTYLGEVRRNTNGVVNAIVFHSYER